MKKFKLEIHNLIWTLDSYKDLHDQMLTDDVEQAYAYLSARVGAQYSYTIWFGAQATIAKWLEGVVITKELIDEIEPVMHDHFKYNGKVWNRSKWDYIVEKFGGKLPIRIKSAPEGTPIEIGNILMSVESTDPAGKCAWLACGLETVLQSGAWYPTTVATRSHLIVNTIRDYFKDTVEDGLQWLADFYLHDFGQRGTTCMEQAGVGGAAHLINSKGTDTKMAIPFAVNYYDASPFDLCHSVPASEHSITTSGGNLEGEIEITRRLCKTFPTGILSDVGDGFDIEKKMEAICTVLKADILARDGKYVVRPDSPRFEGDTPALQILWMAQALWAAYGGITNTKGYKVLDSHVGIIYGDSLTEFQIKDALQLLKDNGFAASTSVYGCGGYLLQKVNRDTERFKFAASAHYRTGKGWVSFNKTPKDKTKKSLGGRLKLVRAEGAHGSTYITVPESDPRPDVLEVVFENGEFVRKWTWAEVVTNARGRTMASLYSK